MRPYLFLALVACSHEVGIEYDDVAKLVGATIATPEGGATLGAVDDSRVLALGGMPAGFVAQPGSIYGNHGTLEHRYMIVQCRDRENVSITCSSLTRMATLVVTWSGTVQIDDVSIASSRQGMWTLANLDFWLPTVTGSSYLQVDGTVGDRTYAITATETESMLVPNGMMGGTVRLELAVTRAQASAEMLAEIAFDETRRSASLVLDGNEAYRIDLATGATE